MAAHYWIFPWISLVASLMAAIGGHFLCLRAPSGPRAAPIPISALIIWLIALAAMVLGGLKLGDWASIDYIPARGILAGAIGGLILTFLLRGHDKSPTGSVAVTIGFATALICACRLWLTHGEMSGLTAAVFSTGFTVVCLTGPLLLEDVGRNFFNRSVIVLAYQVGLAGTVLLGFTRATALGDVYWADLPLMMGAALSVGLLIATAVERYGFFAKAITVTLAFCAVLIPLGVTVAHSLPVIGVTALGFVAAAIPLALIQRSEAKSLPLSLSFLLQIAAITVAFTLFSGYGLGMFAVGCLAAAATAFATGGRVPAAIVTFAPLLLIYRLELLQNVSATRSIGPGNIWDLLAVGLGVIVPAAIASWLTDDPPAGWSLPLQWIAAIALPTIALDYIWQPRTLTGLFLGLAVGQLLVSDNDGRNKANINGYTALLVSLLLFLFLPGIDELTAPTRAVRIACVCILALMIIGKILAHRSSTSSSRKAA